MTQPQAHKPKRFRLSFVGATEDQPRMFRAYGRACGGEFALVMRPSESKALMVFITREGSWAWRAGDQPVLADGVVSAPAEVVQLTNGVRLRVLVGQHKGSAFAPYGELPAGVKAGDRVEITFHPDDQFAHVLPPLGSASDAPRRPERASTAKEAIAAIKAEQKNLPKPGPITLRGQWVGLLHCTEEAQPKVELWRKLATYGTLRLLSDPAGSWSWRFERGDKWFTDEAEVAGDGLPTLSAAIEAGILGAMRLVREACSFRDTQRRAAHDATYAEKHPIPAPRETRDPTERLKEPPPPRVKKPRASRKKKAEPIQAEPASPSQGRAAAPPRPLDDRPLPAAPDDPAALARLAEATEKQAGVLAEVAGITRAWDALTPATEILAWFEDSDFEDEAERIRDYLARPERTVDQFMAEVRALLASNPGDTMEASQQLDRLEATLRSAPVLMERARKLIRYASTMARSPLCKGKEQRESAEAVKRAVATYETARAAILEGRSWDALRTLRRMGERVALSAAKVARSCAAGQQSLTATIAETKPPKPRRQRKPRKAAAAPAPAPAPATPAEVDPAKDKALLDAFSAAIAAAMGNAA